MPFRFGFQTMAQDLAGIVDDARNAEAAGFDIFQVGDHLGAGVAPLVALSAVAAATERISLGTLVLNNDLRHPVVLAHELATLDLACGGRLEVGLGAGHSFTEYDAAGIPFDPPAVRKQRLGEAIEILRALLDGAPTTFRGRHYTLEHATIPRPAQAHVPILVGVNGRSALAHAAGHADIVGLTMLGRTLPDGQHHELRWEASRLDETVAWTRAAAASASADRTVRLHALVQAAVVTDDRTGVAADIATREHMTLDDVLATPFLCLGTHQEMSDHLRECRRRWGIEYYTVRAIEDFEPVIDRLRSA
ncbi:MAG TPA: TIGR03621 family F420-dependent LLM class oxidoreductase [Acidimicrobiales bacterium]|nr:TIGR03621 family F420-dependent LLM class oxidoreductase [Acidimicrobiales bacterium]